MTGSSQVERPTTERLNAFSDGVLAIVVTILVLDIHVPQRLSMQTIPAFLHELEHDLLVYAASFWLVGIYWLWHHIITSYVRHVDQRLLARNLLFLFATTLLPFLTKLKNAYPEDAVTAQLFGVGHLICGLSLWFLWRYVCAHGELRHREVTLHARRSVSVGVGMGCTIALLATSTGHIDPKLCLYLLPTIPVVYGIMLVWHAMERPA